MMASACTVSRPGPLTGEMRDRAADAAIAIQPIALAPRDGGFAGVDTAYAAVRPADLTPGYYDSEAIAVGDLLSITIIESSSGGAAPMLLPGPLQLQALEVGTSGQIAVPYAGSVAAAGRTPDEVRAASAGRLRGKIYAPQVVVARTERREALVTVQGQVATGGAAPIRSGLTRLGDVVGAAQPQLRNARNGVVTLQRDGRAATIALEDLYRDAAQNVALRPGDIVTVTEREQYVSVIGAAGAQGRVEATGPGYSMLDAIADARGLSGTYADPEGVFLLRRNDAAQPPLDIYSLDMRDPLAIAAADQVELREGDVIVLGTASFAQTRQLLSLAAQGLGVTANISRTLD
jgi:polysaccharide export outer membrane protein